MSMGSRPIALVLLSIMTWTMACDGCASRHEKAQPRAEGPAIGSMGNHHPEVKNLGPFDGSLLRYAGEIDFQNHYSSAVMITTRDPVEGAQCSGVLIGPQAALTAGSCVCTPRQVTAGGGGERIIDGSTCAARAYVITVAYGKAHDGQAAGMEARAYAGTVRPHPELRITLDARSSVVTSHADLAVVLLETPVEGRIPHALLASSEVVADEPLVTAGYGHDERIEQVFGERYFRRTRVAQAPSSGNERFSYARMSVDIHGDHGGWPCFREDGKGRWLVGIASKDSGEDLSCLSTYLYQKWLRVEGQRSPRQGDRLE